MNINFDLDKKELLDRAGALLRVDGAVQVPLPRAPCRCAGLQADGAPP